MPEPALTQSQGETIIALLRLIREDVKCLRDCVTPDAKVKVLQERRHLEPEKIAAMVEKVGDAIRKDEEDRKARKVG